ncbi:Spore coat protein U [Bordetella tumbae]|uniref:Csu type fimbrial protein n=1 Tax=Bordetella tumbae TaxID=1649139 RepID=UPI0039F0E88C
MRMLPWLLVFVTAQSAADLSPVSRAFQVQAVVINGCVFGTSASSAVSDLGTIDFGTATDLSSGRDAVSTAGNGSVTLTCTPGMSVSVALGSGLHGASTSARYLKRVNGAELLAYQLYQDTQRTTVWGTGAQALTINNFPPSTQTYTVYARMLNRSGFPVAGEYRDTVVVELSY